MAEWLNVDYRARSILFKSQVQILLGMFRTFLIRITKLRDFYYTTGNSCVVMLQAIFIKSKSWVRILLLMKRKR